MKPVALTIAGFDPCAGAGLQADLLTFHHHGYHPLTVMTTLVVQTPREVTHCEALSAEVLEKQLTLLLETYQISTVKIGLLSTVAQVEVLAHILPQIEAPIVIDPVGIASTGALLQESAVPDLILSELASHATLLTPNTPEAQRLLHLETPPSTLEETAKAAITLAKKAQCAALITGGHHDELSETLTDTLASSPKAIQAEFFPTLRLKDPSSAHGTGCTLASALAAQLGKGLTLSAAIPKAQSYLREALQKADIPASFQAHHPLLTLKHLDCS